MQNILPEYKGMMLEVNNKKNWKAHKTVEIKQLTFKQPIDQRRNYK